MSVTPNDRLSGTVDHPSEYFPKPLSLKAPAAASPTGLLRTPPVLDLQQGPYPGGESQPRSYGLVRGPRRVPIRRADSAMKKRDATQSRR